MDADDYLGSLLSQYEPYPLIQAEEVRIKTDLAGFLVDKITRKKFRKGKLHPNTIKAVTEKVNISLDRKAPIHFVVPFGGYKHFWNPSHPEPDWAELFNFRFLTEFVSPIVSAYEPGVFLEYISEDLILPRMNNYPPDSLEQYAIAFKKLLDRYSKNLPKNLKIDYFRVGDKHDKDKIIAAVDKLLPERRNNFEKLSVEGKERELKRSHRSIYWQGREDLSKLDEKARLERTIESRLIELAYYSVESRPEFIGDYFYGDDHICICFSFGLSHDNSDNDLTLGSTHSSVVDYWIGRGILEKHGERFIPRIVSKEQYESLKGNLTTYPSNLIDMKNFQAIEVYDGVVNFS